MGAASTAQGAIAEAQGIEGEQGCHGEHDYDDQGRACLHLVPLDELRSAVSERAPPRLYRQVLQVEVDILRQLFHRTVPPIPLLPQRLQCNIVQVSPQTAAQFFGLAFARPADQFGSLGDFSAV